VKYEFRPRLLSEELDILIEKMGNETIKSPPQSVIDEAERKAKEYLKR